MKIEKGMTRIVFIPCLLPFVVKFPRVYLLTYLSCLKLGMLRWCFRKSNLRMYLYSGITANMREFMLYLKTHDKRLMPTYFSFFGLFNIQKKGHHAGVYPENLNLNDLRTTQEIHVVENPKSFYDGKLVDYGGKESYNYFLKTN